MGLTIVVVKNDSLIPFSRISISTVFPQVWDHFVTVLDSKLVLVKNSRTLLPLKDPVHEGQLSHTSPSSTQPTDVGVF